MKIVMAAMLGDEFLNDLKTSFPEVTFEAAPNDEEQKHHIKDADVFFGWPSREVFLSADRLRWIHCPGTGIDQIVSTPEVADSDIVLTNARGPHTGPMADHVIGTMLALAHRARELWEDQRARRWCPSRYHDRMLELGGRTMGILALGGIGMAVARRAHGFGMKVYAVDKRPVPRPPEVAEVWGIGKLGDLLRVSDWLVVTAPLTSETRGLLDRRRIGLLKSGAHVIVVSRGGIVDEGALIDGLRSGHIAGAALDVAAEEPPPPDSPLWDMDNLILSPHVSASSPEMVEGRKRVFKENVRRFLAGEPFLYTCDKRAGF